MKKLFLILLIIPVIAIGQVNLSVYGVVGNGIADDTAAIQSALNNQNNLIASPGKTFKISGTLQLNQSFEHNINWNGATITTSTTDLTFFNINKKNSNGGSTAMQNLLIDAGSKGSRGVTVYSRAHLINIDGKDYGQSPTSSISPSHIMARFEGNDSDAHGDWIFDGCDVDGLMGYGDYCDYCDGIGASNGYLVYWMTVPTSKTTITFKNSSSLNGFGVDGQNVGVFSPSINVSNTLASTVFDNVTTRGFDRRGWKIFCGNVTVKNSLVQDNPETDGVYTCGNTGKGANCTQVGAPGTRNLSAGLFTFGRGSGASGATNLRVDNTRFVGEASGGTDNRFILVDTDDVEISNSSFEGGADLAFTLNVKDVKVCNSVFNQGSSIYGYSVTYSGMISIGTNTTGPTGYVNTPSNRTQYITCP